GIGVVGLVRQHDKPGGVVDLVLDVALEDLQPIDLSCEPTRYCRQACIRRFGDNPRRTCRISFWNRRQPQFPQCLTALAEGMGVAQNLRDIFQPGAWLRHQLMTYPQEMLTDDVEPGVWQEMMDIGNTTSDRILDRDHGILRLTVTDSTQR